MTPFAPPDWPQKELRMAAVVLWNWHRSVQDEPSAMTYRDEALSVCKKFCLPIHFLDSQVYRGGVPIPKSASELFEYIDAYAGSHAILLAKLAGYTSNWIEAPVKQFARAIFLTRSVTHLKEDLQEGRHFIPRDMMESKNITQTDLIKGSLSKEIQSVLWKQIVRARDAFAACHPLNSDLNGWCRRQFRIYWIGGLQMLAYIESRKFDVWSRPVRLSLLRKTNVYLQAYIGKTNR